MCVLPVEYLVPFQGHPVYENVHVLLYGSVCYCVCVFIV